MVFSPQELVIGCAVSDGWAGQQCRRFVEKAGARILRVTPAGLDASRTIEQLSACIYDLAPWDAGVPDRIHRMRQIRPAMPVLLYLPPSPAALAMVPDCVRVPNIRVAVQLRVREEVRRFEQDARWLVRSIPVQRILDVLGSTVPATPLVQLFWHVVLRSISVGNRCTVDQAGRDLGVSGRTVQRHFESSVLGSPKQLIDRLTLWYIFQLAETGSTSLAQASRTVGMGPSDLYRFKKRVIRSILRSDSREIWCEMIGDSLERLPVASSRRPTPDPGTFAGWCIDPGFQQ